MIIIAAIALYPSDWWIFVIAGVIILTAFWRIFLDDDTTYLNK